MKERVYVFSERTERSIIDRMRDLDEMIAQTRRMYPENDWTRGDFLLLFFLDGIGDGIQQMAKREAGE